MTLPNLLISYTADNCVFPSDFDGIVDAVASSDKQVLRIAADHYGHPIEPDAQRRDHAAGVIGEWIRSLG